MAEMLKLPQPCFNQGWGSFGFLADGAPQFLERMGYFSHLMGAQGAPILPNSASRAISIDLNVYLSISVSL